MGLFTDMMESYHESEARRRELRGENAFDDRFLAKMYRDFDRPAPASRSTTIRSTSVADKDSPPETISTGEGLLAIGIALGAMIYAFVTWESVLYAGVGFSVGAGLGLLIAKLCAFALRYWRVGLKILMFLGALGAAWAAMNIDSLI